MLTILDQFFAEEYRAKREATDGWHWDEIWDGHYMVMPLPDNNHANVMAGFCMTLGLVYGIGEQRIATVVHNVVVSESRDYRRNDRGPDASVFLPGNRAKDRRTHYQGGPDFLLEIVSPDDMSRDKLPFYASIGTREVLLIDRDPWQLELYQLRRGKLHLAGTAKPGNGKALASNVVPLTFALGRGKPRPKIRITETKSDQQWTF